MEEIIKILDKYASWSDEYMTHISATHFEEIAKEISNIDKKLNEYTCPACNKVTTNGDCKEKCYKDQSAKELLTDDQDIRDTKLSIDVHNNGDYYLTLTETKKGKVTKLDTRISTSGGNASREVVAAIENLYRVMNGYKDQSPKDISDKEIDIICYEATLYGYTPRDEKMYKMGFKAAIKHLNK